MPFTKGFILMLFPGMPCWCPSLTRILLVHGLPANGINFKWWRSVVTGNSIKVSGSSRAVGKVVSIVESVTGARQWPGPMIMDYAIGVWTMNPVHGPEESLTPHNLFARCCLQWTFVTRSCYFEILLFANIYIIQIPTFHEYSRSIKHISVRIVVDFHVYFPINKVTIAHRGCLQPLVWIPSHIWSIKEIPNPDVIEQTTMASIVTLDCIWPLSLVLKDWFELNPSVAIMTGVPPARPSPTASQIWCFMHQVVHDACTQPGHPDAFEWWSTDPWQQFPTQPLPSCWLLKWILVVLSPVNGDFRAQPSILTIGTIWAAKVDLYRLGWRHISRVHMQDN